MKRILSAIVLAVAALSIAVPAHALSISSSRSSFSSSRSTPSYSGSASKYWGTPKPAAPAVPKYTAPTPPRPVIQQKQNVTVNRSTTIVQQAAPSGGGSGFMGSFLGSMAGVGIGNWLFGPKPQQPAPQQVIDCAKQPLPAEWAPHCPAKQ